MVVWVLIGVGAAMTVSLLVALLVGAALGEIAERLSELDFDAGASTPLTRDKRSARWRGVVREIADLHG